MNKYIYVINNEYDKNLDPYPNYIYIINDDGSRTYFDTDFKKIDSVNHSKYLIKGKGKGKRKRSNKKIIGGGYSDSDSDSENTTSSYSAREADEIAKLETQIQFNKYKENRRKELENKKEYTEYPKEQNIKTDLTAFTMFRVIFSNMVIQPFFTSKSTLKKYIGGIISNKKIQYKHGDDIYQFSNDTNSKNIIELFDKSLLCGSSNIGYKYQYQIDKVAYCINTNCYRFTKFNKIGNQRQECDQCTGWFRLKKKSDPTVPKAPKAPKGLKIKLDDEKDNDGNIIKIFTITDADVSTSYNLMCYNNFNPEYWSTLKNENRKDGVKITDQDTYRFTYVPQFKQDVNRIVHLKHQFKRYYCELNNSHEDYPTDICELDHKDGNHYNNVISNIMCLCKNCHGIKTYLQNDKGIGSEGTKTASNIIKVLADPDTFIKKLQKFSKNIYDFLNNNIIILNSNDEEEKMEIKDNIQKYILLDYIRQDEINIKGKIKVMKPIMKKMAVLYKKTKLPRLNKDGTPKMELQEVGEEEVEVDDIEVLSSTYTFKHSKTDIISYNSSNYLKNYTGSVFKKYIAHLLESQIITKNDFDEITNIKILSNQTKRFLELKIPNLDTPNLLQQSYTLYSYVNDLDDEDDDDDE